METALDRPVAYTCKEVAEEETDQPVAYCDSVALQRGNEILGCETVFLRMLEQCSVEPSIERLLRDFLENKNAAGL